MDATKPWSPAHEQGPPAKPHSALSKPAVSKGAAKKVEDDFSWDDELDDVAAPASANASVLASGGALGKDDDDDDDWEKWS